MCTSERLDSLWKNTNRNRRGVGQAVWSTYRWTAREGAVLLQGGWRGSFSDLLNLRLDL